MRKFLCNMANIILKPAKISALKSKDLVLQQKLLDSIFTLYNEQPTWLQVNSNWVGVLFSMDRACQLDAFLRSCAENLKPLPDIHILYCYSNEKHKQAYDLVAQCHQKFPVSFHKQQNNTSFRADLLALMEKLSQGKIAFFVDDDVIKEPTDVTELLELPSHQYVPSLRMGLNITYNYTTDTPITQPPMLHDPLAGDDKIVWQWGDGILDWGYPLSLEGNILNRREILAMLKLLDFSAPNSLEDVMQHLNPIFHKRYGIAFKQSKSVNIPCNKVQQENKNIHGAIHQDTILDHWLSGHMIDLELIYGCANQGAHEEIPVRFCPRP